MRSLKSALIVVVLALSLLASGVAFAADRSSGGGGYKGGGPSRGGGYKSGGPSRGGGYKGGGYYHGGGHKGSYHRSDVDVVIGGSFWGPPWYYPSYYYPYDPFYYPYYYPYYYPPVVEVPSSPPVYIERSRPELSALPNVWFYCPDSKTYYPYVKECKGGWQTVPAKPPSEQER